MERLRVLPEIEQVQDRVFREIQIVTGYDLSETPDRNLVDDADLDSLALIELADRLDAAFGITIPVNLITSSNFSTGPNIAAMIMSLLKPH